MNASAAGGTPYDPSEETGPPEEKRASLAGLRAALVRAGREVGALSEQVLRYRRALIDSGDRRIAAEKRAKRAEALIDKMTASQGFFSRLTDAEHERDAALASIEAALRYARVNVDVAEVDGMVVILCGVPADALREHDAALIDALAGEAREQDEGSGAADWLQEKAHQRREEREHG